MKLNAASNVTRRKRKIAESADPSRQPLHYLPGGWTHSFTLEGYRFSPGVHYLGGIHQGGALCSLYEGLGVADELEFREMNPDGFDHFLIEGRRFDQPKGKERWQSRLCSIFPKEQRGIERYFATVDDLIRDVKRVETLFGFPQVLSIPWRAPNLVKWGFRTLQPLLMQTTRDPMLRAVLSAQCGNHGLPPSRVSLPLHAAMASHYYDGAYYPRGGAKRIPQALIKMLRRKGGQIKVSTRVVEILTKASRAVGVRTAEGQVFEANDILCNADPAVVYGKLLPQMFCASALRKVLRTEYSVSLLSVFCAVEMDLRALGYDSGNYWLYRTTDLDGIYRSCEGALPPEDIQGLFLAISSLKDPGSAPKGQHVIELFTFVPYAPFARWAGTTLGARDADYIALKRELGDRVLRAAEHIIPGLRRHVRFIEVGTPLTNDFYCDTYRGAIYGSAKTPWQVGPFSFSQRGPIAGLHFCGASIISHGIGGASMSGLIAAANILGLDSMDKCLAPTGQTLRIFPADRPETWLRSREQAVRPSL